MVRVIHSPILVIFPFSRGHGLRGNATPLSLIQYMISTFRIKNSGSRLLTANIFPQTPSALHCQYQTIAPITNQRDTGDDGQNLTGRHAPHRQRINTIYSPNDADRSQCDTFEHVSSTRLSPLTLISWLTEPLPG